MERQSISLPTHYRKSVTMVYRDMAKHVIIKAASLELLQFHAPSPNNCLNLSSCAINWNSLCEPVLKAVCKFNNV